MSNNWNQSSLVNTKLAATLKTRHTRPREDYSAKFYMYTYRKCWCKHVKSRDFQKDNNIHYILRLVSTFGFFEAGKLSELLLLDSIWKNNQSINLTTRSSNYDTYRDRERERRSQLRRGCEDFQLKERKRRWGW